ncbi:outer membrane beta-barrel protein [Legionella maioricensis]|uniref:Outer membrane beta-barrel protein n=1 Tax=Legionella maioricensis TaxID=2896528 RepID=A0A9X2CZ93_9GAMM|nr:outer membrane beta-barrel protein [Legionella maioricensis]MCL9686775.1 outer membrane beta-barrel protein [Legionella maioricensis]
MINKKTNLYLFSLIFIFPIFCHAKINDRFNHPFYVGALGGFGSTTWQGLVPSQINQNLAISMSTPVSAQEGGHVWGFLAGYEISPFFALEANYIHYPYANIIFESFSLFSFNHNGLTKFTTNTEVLSLMGKVMLIIPDTKMRLYSSAGAANLHREDMVVDDWRLSPAFGVGLNYHIAEHLMGELGFHYTAGYGESQLNPADTYFPFIYSVTLRLAYCF